MPNYAIDCKHLFNKHMQLLSNGDYSMQSMLLNRIIKAVFGSMRLLNLFF